MSRITYPCNEFSKICRKALEKSELMVEKGDISFVDFTFDPPSDNHTLWSIIMDKEVIPLGKCRIKNSDSLLRLRDWIERAIQRDNLSKNHNLEMCNIECLHSSYCLIIHHKGWYCHRKVKPESVSSLIIIDKTQNADTVNCLCLTKPTLGRIYKALVQIAGKKISDSLKSENIERILINYL